MLESAGICGKRLEKAGTGWKLIGEIFLHLGRTQPDLVLVLGKFLRDSRNICTIKAVNEFDHKA